jgi:hypothetical protein
MGIVLPMSAQAEERVLAQSNFENCNLGTYTEANQTTADGLDLRNGIVANETAGAISTGYTMKNPSTGKYEPVSEADIVEESGQKVLRLSSFLKGVGTTGYPHTDTYPYIVTPEFANVGKVRIDMEAKVEARASFWTYHSATHLGGNRRLWRLDNGNSTSSKLRVFDNTTPTNTALVSDCRYYNKYSIIMDAATGYSYFYLNGEKLHEGKTAKEPSTAWKYYIKQACVDLMPTVEKNGTVIESVTDPQYVYVKSLKITEYNNTALEKVRPAKDAVVTAPEEVVFTFNNDIKTVEKAEVYDLDAGKTDVTSSIVISGNRVKVPYLFEGDKEYEVTLTGVSDGTTSTDAETYFTSSSWNYSNISTPIKDSIEDKNVYYINEDFTNCTSDSRETMIQNTSGGWYFEAPATKGTAEIVDLGGGNKAFQVSCPTDQTVTQVNGPKNTLNDKTVLSFDVFIEEGTSRFDIRREAGGNLQLFEWFKGLWSASESMSAGEWHNITVDMKDFEASLYVDGKFVKTTPSTVGLADSKYIRFTTTAGTVKIDNLKLYNDNNSASVTALAPAFDGTAKVSEPIEFTYDEVIGDVANAQLIVKKGNTSKTLTNGNGMDVKVVGNTVKLILDDALDANAQYAVELSGLKDIKGTIVNPVRTKFTTVAADEWTLGEVVDKLSTTEPNVKSYTVKVKHQGAAENAQLIVATYNTDGSLTAVALSAVTSVGEDWTDLTVARARFYQGETTKLFVWNSVDGMTPVLDVISK